MSLADRLFAPESFFQKRFYFLARRFVAGETIPQALDAVRSLNEAGMSASIDFLGEDILDRGTAAKTTQTYMALFDALESSRLNSNVSVKLTAIGLRIDPEFAFENLRAIVARAQRNADPFVRIDMEGSAVTDATLELFYRVYAEYKNVGPVLQAYLKRTPADVDRAIEIGSRVRLCKGAYSEPPEIAYKSMSQIREQYIACAKRLLEHGTNPGIATHDRRIIEAVKTFAGENAIAPDRFEFQMLYGVRPKLQREMVRQGYRLRIYVPFGTHWAGYFYRRVLERRENALFALSSIFSR